MLTIKQYLEEKKHKKHKQTPKAYLGNYCGYYCLDTIFGQHSIGNESSGEGGEQGGMSEEKIMSDDEVQDVAKRHSAYFGDNYTAKQKKENDESHEKVGRPSSLGQGQGTALRIYTSESSFLNKKLHTKHDSSEEEHKPLTKEQKENVHMLDKALSSHKTHEDTIVYSGLKRSPHTLFKRKADGTKFVHRPNTVTVHHPAYLSTSTNFSGAVKFARSKGSVWNDTSHMTNEVPDEDKKFHGGHKLDGVVKHVLAIHVPAGTHAQSVRHISTVGRDEQEVLIHRGHNLEIDHEPTIVEHENENGKKKKVAVWHAKIVDHIPEKIS